MSSQVAKPAKAARVLAMPSMAELGTSWARCTPSRSVKEIRKYFMPRCSAMAPRSVGMASPSPRPEQKGGRSPSSCDCGFALGVEEMQAPRLDRQPDLVARGDLGLGRDAGHGGARLADPRLPHDLRNELL